MGDSGSVSARMKFIKLRTLSMRSEVGIAPEGRILNESMPRMKTILET